MLFIYDSLGDYLMRTTFSPAMSIKDVALLAIQALSAVKSYETYCGGPSQFMEISANGTMTNSVPYVVGDAELYISDFATASRRLLFDIGDLKTDTSDFDQRLQVFIAEVKRIRRYWISGQAPGFQRYKELVGNFKAEERPDQQSTTDGPSSQQP